MDLATDSDRDTGRGTLPLPPLAQAIRRARERAGLTQEDLAGKLDVTAHSLGKWERGITTPRPSMMNKLETHLGQRLPRPIRDVAGLPVTDGTGAELPPLDPGAFEADDQDTLATYIKRAMKARGIDTARGLAKRCGFAPNTALSLLKGTIEPADRTLRQIADGLGVPLSILHRLAERPDPTLIPYVPPSITARFPSHVRPMVDAMLAEWASRYPASLDDTGEGDQPVE